MNFDSLTHLHEANLSDVASILERVESGDGMGGVAGFVYSSIDSDVPCRISPVSSRDRIIGDQSDPAKDVLIVFEKDYSLTDDKFIFVNGNTFEVQYVEPQPTFSAMLRVFARKVD